MAGSAPLTVPQCCTHQLGMECVQVNRFLCQATNCPCTSDCPLENCRNWDPIWAPTEQRLTTNVSQNTKEAQEVVRSSIRPPPRSSFTQTHRHSRLAYSQEDPSGLPYRHAPTPPTRFQCSPRPPPPTLALRRLSGAAKEIQIAHNQRKAKTCPPVRPPTLTVTSRWWPVLEGVTATQIPPGRLSPRRTGILA